MATEALDYSRNTDLTIRLPHRLRVFLRALRLARTRRALKLCHQLADRDDRILADVGVSLRRDGHHDWIPAIALSQIG